MLENPGLVAQPQQVRERGWRQSQLAILTRTAAAVAGEPAVARGQRSPSDASSLAWRRQPRLRGGEARVGEKRPQRCCDRVRILVGNEETGTVPEQLDACGKRCRDHRFPRRDRLDEHTRDDLVARAIGKHYDVRRPDPGEHLLRRPVGVVELDHIVDAQRSRPRDQALTIARQIPESIAKRFCLMPVTEVNGRVVVAMADPLDVIARDTIRLKLDREIETVIGCEQDIRHAIEWVYHGSNAEEQRIRDLVFDEGQENDEAAAAVAESLSDGMVADISVTAEAGKAPVIQFVDLLLSQAVKSRASDIHIEPQEKSMTIRLRVDGMLRETVPPSPRMQAAVVTRIKILAAMDVAERRLPQDGRFKIKATGRDIDVRVSVIPTIYGEKVVMRILDKIPEPQPGGAWPGRPYSQAAQGRPFTAARYHDRDGADRQRQEHDAFLRLNYLKDPKKNITTVEDPVEYRLAGINQIQVKPGDQPGFCRMSPRNTASRPGYHTR